MTNTYGTAGAFPLRFGGASIRALASQYRSSIIFGGAAIIAV